jgi:hypothetical protein
VIEADLEGQATWDPQCSIARASRHRVGGNPHRKTFLDRGSLQRQTVHLLPDSCCFSLVAKSSIHQRHFHALIETMLNNNFSDFLPYTSDLNVALN